LCARAQALQRAAKLQREKGDAFVGVDVLLLAVIESKDAGEALAEAGVARAQVEAAIAAVRGGGHRVDTASADTTFEALLKYGNGALSRARVPAAERSRRKRMEGGGRRCASLQALKPSKNPTRTSPKTPSLSPHTQTSPPTRPSWTPLSVGMRRSGASCACCAAARRTTRC